MTTSILDYRERCMSTLHVVKTNLKRLKEYPLDFSKEVAEMEQLKDKIESKISDLDNLNRIVTKATLEMDMGIKLAREDLAELEKMKGVSKQ